MYGKVHNCSRGCCYVEKSAVKRIEEKQWRDEFLVGFDAHEEYESYLMKMCPCPKHADLPDEMDADFEYDA